MGALAEKYSTQYKLQRDDSELGEKYSTQYKLQRDDSTDELLKSVHAQREARKKQLLASANKQNNNDDDSGRSTPEHLKKYSGSAAFNDNCNGTSTGSNS